MRVAAPDGTRLIDYDWRFVEWEVDGARGGYGMSCAHCAESVYCWNDTIWPFLKR